MKKMRTFLFITLAVFLLLSCLTGCANEQTKTTTTTSLTDTGSTAPEETTAEVTTHTGTPLTLTRLSASSWFRLDVAGLIIHFDPGFNGSFENQGIPAELFEAKADIVLISHFHKDHLQPEALRRIMKEETLVVSPQGFDNPYGLQNTVLQPGGFLEHEGVSIKAVYAYNTPQGHSTSKLHIRGENNGYLLTAGGRCVYFAGDTDCIPEMSSLGAVDIALLPIGGTYVMDAGEAVEALKAIAPRAAVPMHQASADMNNFKRTVEKNTSVSVSVLEIGEKVVF